MSLSQDYVKLRSIMREELGLIRSSKLNIGADDSVLKVANKTAAYVYKNSDEPTEDDVISALYARVVGQDFVNIERVEETDVIDKVIAFHGTDEKFLKEREDGNRYIFKASQGQRQRDVFILVDPSIKVSNHNAGMTYKNYASIVDGIYKVYFFRLDKLLGHDKVSRLLIDELYASELPSQTIDDVKKFAKEYKRLTDHRYGQKKYAYYTEYDEVLVDVGQDLINQNYDVLREKGWQITLGELEQYSWWDSKTKSHIKEMLPSNYQLVKYDENTKTIEHTAYYTHRTLAAYERRGDLERMPYMKFFDQTLKHMYRDEMNVQAMEKYARERSSDVASAWETKKNIPDATLQAMRNTTFKEDFNFVEFDERVDLTLLPRLEKEWEAFREVLPKADVKPDLRFRLLGHHRASGIFVPLVNSIGIDPREERMRTDGKLIKINGMTSLAHEYAHFLDYNFDKGTSPLSLRRDFATILEKYQKTLDDLPTNHPFKMTNSKYGLDYFKTPTEVFARGFELYISGYDNVKSAFVQEAVEFKRPEYQAFEGSEEILINYFDERFPEMDHALKAFQVDESFIKEIQADFDPFVEVEVSKDAYIPVELISSKEMASIHGVQMSLDI